MRCIAIAASAIVAALGGPTVVASADPPAQSVRVSPATRLQAGDPVRVTARGLPAAMPVTIFLCRSPADEWSWCETSLGRATTTARGTLSLRVRVADPVYYTPDPAIQPQPTYCRADNCRVFVTWTDAAGAPVSVGSDPLEFTGSPATVIVSPDTDLEDLQPVRVTGTAFGSDARAVEIWQHECLGHFGEVACWSENLLATVPLRRDDTFAATVRVQKYGGYGGQICGGDNSSSCLLTAYIIDPRTGLPDPTFGDPAFAEPRAGIYFTPDPTSATPQGAGDGFVPVGPAVRTARMSPI